MPVHEHHSAVVSMSSLFETRKLVASDSGAPGITFAKLSSPSSLKGIAVETSSMYTSEKRKAMSSCEIRPGATNTIKPTRKSFFHASSSSHQK